MFDPTTLLVSRDPGLIGTLGPGGGTTAVGLPAWCSAAAPENAYSDLRRADVFLVIAHLTSSRDAEDYRSLLREAAACPRATTALVCDDETTARRGQDCAGAKGPARCCVCRGTPGSWSG